MKKVISLLLIVVMICSLGVTAFATNDYTQGTQVVYTGAGAEAYTITVPALLAPGDEGTVTLSGTWASNKMVKVTADATVTLTNSINSADQKVLDVTFDSIEKAGDNTVSRTYTEKVAVAEMPADALFGTWSGRFNYYVEYINAVKIEAVTIDNFDGAGIHSAPTVTIHYEQGMTWGEWLESKYNAPEVFEGISVCTWDDSMDAITCGGHWICTRNTPEDLDGQIAVKLSDIIDSNRYYICDLP